VRGWPPILAFAPLAGFVTQSTNRDLPSSGAHPGYARAPCALRV